MSAPLVSVILPTRDRPGFLPVALRCVAEQCYPNIELIVIDSGEHAPADEALVRAHDGQLIRVAPGTPLGEKLNIGAQAARGAFLQKMDDDDWYAPGLIERLIAAFDAR